MRDDEGCLSFFIFVLFSSRSRAPRTPSFTGQIFVSLILSNNCVRAEMKCDWGRFLPLLLLLNEKEKINRNWNSVFGLFTVSAGTSACTWSCWRLFWVFGVCLQTKVVRGVKRIVCECKLKSGFRSEKKKRWNVDDDAMKCKNKILN